MTIAGQPSPEKYDSPPAEVYQPLPPRAKNVWLIENAATSTTVLLLTMAVFYLPAIPDSWQLWRIPVAAVILALGLFEAAVFIPLRYRYYRFRVTDDHVVIQRGKLIRRVLVLPLHHVLFVETRQGPVLARYGLVRVQLGTIAEHHPLGPVPPAVADEIRAAVQRRGRSAD